MKKNTSFDGLSTAKKGGFGSETDTDERITPSVSDMESAHHDDLDPEPQSLKGIIKRWPKSTFCIIGNEFCERFSFTGMRTVLTLYVINILAFSDNNATILFHSFIVLSYASPLIGSILADGYIGKFWTIFWISLVYAAGNVILAVASTFSKTADLHPYLDIAGLAVIGFGTGGIKPCVCAFGGDQFNPTHLRMISMFFSVFYFAINVGSTLSTLITPELRTIACNGTDSCYPLAFGIPAILMVLATISFMSGSVYYKKFPPKENVMSRVVRTAWRALKNKFTSKQKREHWLEHFFDTHVCDEDTKCLALRSSGKVTEEKCAQKKFVEDVKSLVRVCIVLSPVPMFWALYDQQGSRWIIQAVAMDSKVTEHFTLLPDQMITFNAILVMLFIPFFQGIVYPLFEKVGIRTTPLRRLVAGGTLAAGSFIISGFLQLGVNQTLPDVPSSNMAFVSFINTYPACNINVETPGYANKFIPGNSSLIDDKVNNRAELYRLDVGAAKDILFNLKFEGASCKQNSASYTASLKGGKSFYVIVSPQGISQGEAIWDKPTEGNGQSSLNLNFQLPCSMVPNSVQWATCDAKNVYSGRLALCPQTDTNDSRPCNPRGRYYGWDKDDILDQTIQWNGSPVLNSRIYDFVDVRPGKYKVYYIYHNNTESDSTPTSKEIVAVPVEGLDLEIEGMGGVYSYVAWAENLTTGLAPRMSVHMIVPKNHYNILMQVPQYAVITASEVLFSITGLEFAYSQAAPTMKSVVQALWLLTVAFGDIIIIIISKLDLFSNLAVEMFAYAGAMLVVIAAFTLLAMFYYEYADFSNDASTDSDSTSRSLSSVEDTMTEKTNL